MDLIPVVDEGLGNSAYLLDLGDGRALAVDPSLDLRRVTEAAQRRRLRIAYAAETHLHADFLSGVLQLAQDHGAQVLASAAGDRTYEHMRLVDGDAVDLGGLTLRALATPGHTVEHLSFLLLDGAREVGVFTGGSLIVGAAARTDLVACASHRASWPARSTGRCVVSRNCPTRRRCGPPTAPGRSAPPRQVRSGPPPSAPRRPRTAC